MGQASTQGEARGGNTLRTVTLKRALKQGVHVFLNTSQEYTEVITHQKIKRRAPL